jgi:hypothetical protein
VDLIQPDVCSRFAVCPEFGWEEDVRKLAEFGFAVSNQNDVSKS